MSAAYPTNLSTERDLGWLILTFLRAKESEFFRLRCTKQHVPDLAYIEQLSYPDFTQDEDGDDDLSTASDSRLASFSLCPASLWAKIEEQLSLLEEESELDVVFAHYTHILHLHVHHDIQLDFRCLRSLLYCLQPRLIQSLFDRQLISPAYRRAISLHFSCEDPFFQPVNLRDLVCSRDLGDLFISYALLVNAYIAAERPASGACRQIVPTFKKLGQVLNHERFKESTSTTSAAPAFKLLILAAIQNGLFSRATLAELLASKESNSYASRMLMGEDSDTSSGSSDEDEEMDFDEVMQERQAMRVAAANGLRPGGGPVKKSIGERVNVRVEGIFPLSLKNLARVQIKCSLADYSASSVRRLAVLPQALKEFVLFREENSACLRFASHLRTGV